MKKLVFLCAALMTGACFAKLPALNDEAKAKADEAKAKTAWSDKVAAFQLCKAQDRTAAHYLKTKAVAEKPPVATPACADPGAYVSPLTAAAATPAASNAAVSIPANAPAVKK
ncbi:hypothetical protein LPB67_03825 [Undibacterium sp. Jales W-56]|uniref:hypothetical protein n=1 Tax=Undibacterium sp. Jales W-56 TaxID=2897325 RepID=UPI0021CE1E87|nr:hypothetical protein [Undibacterium sp. Jales W-56]MCU6432906.1 hypothetical protein [Undibacterium sp. Jales W-56]